MYDEKSELNIPLLYVGYLKTLFLKYAFYEEVRKKQHSYDATSAPMQHRSPDIHFLQSTSLSKYV